MWTLQQHLLAEAESVFGLREPAGNTTVVKHGRDGVTVTLRTALVVASANAIIFILIAKLGLGFDGGLISLAATISLPALLVAAAWALLGSLA